MSGKDTSYSIRGGTPKINAEVVSVNTNRRTSCTGENITWEKEIPVLVGSSWRRHRSVSVNASCRNVGTRFLRSEYPACALEVRKSKKTSSKPPDNEGPNPPILSVLTELTHMCWSSRRRHELRYRKSANFPSFVSV